jgi:septal ring factor EnvC (AmiA/AmiB activator)
VSPPDDPGTVRILAALAALVLTAADAGAADTDDAATKLRQIERAIETGREQQKSLETQARRLQEGIVTMRSNLIDTAASVQDYETQVTDIENRLKALSAEESAKASDLRRRQGELSTVIGILARFGRHPPGDMILQPGGAVDAVRGARVLAGVVPELQERSDSLRAELVALRELRHEIGNRQSALLSATETLFRERQALDRLLSQTARLHRQTMTKQEESRERIARLAEEAKDLRGLMERLRQEEKRIAREAPDSGRIPEASRPFSSVRGRLGLPARGQIVGGFGDRNQFGTINRGLQVKTRPSAQVVAPYDGRILYAGAFRSYGQLLIISHGEGYHSLIAGMSRIDGVVGQWLLAGEPIGRMGEGNDAESVLYVELRHDGEPINPLPWLAASERKVSG